MMDDLPALGRPSSATRNAPCPASHHPSVLPFLPAERYPYLPTREVPPRCSRRPSTPSVRRGHTMGKSQRKSRRPELPCSAPSTLFTTSRISRPIDAADGQLFILRMQSSRPSTTINGSASCILGPAPECPIPFHRRNPARCRRCRSEYKTDPCGNIMKMDLESHRKIVGWPPVF